MSPLQEATLEVLAGWMVLGMVLVFLALVGLALWFLAVGHV